MLCYVITHYNTNDHDNEHDNDDDDDDDDNNTSPAQAPSSNPRGRAPVFCRGRMPGSPLLARWPSRAAPATIPAQPAELNSHEMASTSRVSWGLPSGPQDGRTRIVYILLLYMYIYVYVYIYIYIMCVCIYI